MEHQLATKDTYISEYRKKIGNMVKESREKMGLSQDDLAEMMNINRSTISKVENGKFAITVDFLAKLDWYLKFDLNFVKKS